MSAVLFLHDCDLQAVPEEEVDGHGRAVEVLNLSFNRLKNLYSLSPGIEPHGSQRLLGLRHLDVSHNKLTTLLGVEALPMLQVLRANGNPALSSAAPLALRSIHQGHATGSGSGPGAGTGTKGLAGSSSAASLTSAPLASSLRELWLSDTGLLEPELLTLITLRNLAVLVLKGSPAGAHARLREVAVGHLERLVMLDNAAVKPADRRNAAVFLDSIDGKGCMHRLRAAQNQLKRQASLEVSTLSHIRPVSPPPRLLTSRMSLQYPRTDHTPHHQTCIGLTFAARLARHRASTRPALGHRYKLQPKPSLDRNHEHH